MSEYASRALLHYIWIHFKYCSSILGTVFERYLDSKAVNYYEPIFLSWCDSHAA